MTTTDPRFILVDIETTGLTPATEVILEIGMVIADADLEVFDTFETVIWDTPLYDAAKRVLFDKALGNTSVSQADQETAQYVVNMHTKSGLWDRCAERGVPLDVAEGEAMDWLKGHGIQPNEPMVGSSVGFDRSFLAEHCPELEELFFYRNIDVSSIKELCSRWNPDLYAKLPVHAPARKLHRAVADCVDTLAELRFYRDNFFFLPPVDFGE